MISAFELKEGLLVSTRAIRANKMRALLTMIGIAFGIWAVTMMATAIEGVGMAFEKSTSAFGAKVLYVQKFAWASGEEEFWKARNRKNLQVEYADVIARQAKLIDAVAPVVGTARTASAGSRTMLGAFVSGTTAGYQEASGTTIQEGRFFSQEESDGGRPVCVIGADVAETLFPNTDPIDQTVKVGGYPYRILATLEKQGGLFGAFTSDYRIFIPIKSFMNEFGTRRDVSLNVRVSQNADLDDAKEELRGIMRKVRSLAPGQEDDFSINEQEVLLRLFQGITTVIAMVGFIITGLSLFVGGIGIMNIMYVSVTERTREIGIRKAIGARRGTILFQFLAEAAIICLFGGMIGLVVAYPSSLILDQILPTVMPFSVVFIALAVSALTGIISGFLPAFKASKLDPVDALRYE